MTEQTPSRIGTVAQEAARLIEDMAAMASSGSTGSQHRSPYAGQPAQASTSSDAPPQEQWADDPSAAEQTADTPPAGACRHCGGQPAGTGTPENCRLCPLCQGIALLRSVRPETVDQLADLASAVAGWLRDMAAQSGASGPASPARPASERSSDGGRATLDIPVDDESEG